MDVEGTGLFTGCSAARLTLLALSLLTRLLNANQREKSFFELHKHSTTTTTTDREWHEINFRMHKRRASGFRIHRSSFSFAPSILILRRIISTSSSFAFFEGENNKI